MRIVIVTTKFAPFGEYEKTGNDIAFLAEKLVKEGNDVHVVFPMPENIDIAFYSLARRLTPTTITLNKNSVEFCRFEGKSTSGVQLYLFQPQQKIESNFLSEGFSKAAAKFIDSLINDDTRLIIWRGHKEMLCAQFSDKIKKLAIIADKTDSTLNLSNFENVAVIGRSLCDEMTRDEATSLHDLNLKGKVAFLPHATAEHPLLSSDDKASAKASIQSILGLPIKTNVPVLLFPNGIEQKRHGVLAKFLTGNVQVIIWGAKQNNQLEKLSKRYPDRLAVISQDTLNDAVLAASDFCFGIKHSQDTVKAMSFGVVPIVMPQFAEGVVDLETSLESGSGFVLDNDSEASINFALGEATTAFSRTNQFKQLSMRISQYTSSWSQLAKTIISLIK